MSQQNACYAGGFCSLYLTEWNSDFTTSYGTVEIAKGTHMGMTCGWCTQGVYYGTCVYGCTNKGMIEVFRVNYNHFDDTILVQMQATNSCNTTSRSPDLMKLPSDISCVCDYYTQLYSCGKTYMTYGPICHCFNCACVNRTFSALSPDCSATCPIIYTSMHVTGISDHLSNGFMTLTRMIPQDTATVLTQSVICSTYCFCDKPEICYAFDGLCAFGQGGIVFNQYVTCMRCICIGNSCCNPAFGCQGVEQRKILPQGYMFSTWRPYNEGQMSKPTGGHQRTNLDFKYT
jgi:hypothetical protein